METVLQEQFKQGLLDLQSQLIVPDPGRAGAPCSLYHGRPGARPHFHGNSEITTGPLIAKRDTTPPNSGSRCC